MQRDQAGLRHVDDVAFWWLDSYVDFTDEQEPRVKAELKRLHAWHRAEELPRLASLLKNIEELAAQDVTAQQVCAFWPRVQGRMQAVVDRAAPAAAAFAAEMGDLQFANLERKYSKNNREFRREWAGEAPAHVLKKRREQLAERAENAYGKLTPAQHRLIEEHVAQSSFDARKVAAERQRRQQDALQTLRKISGQRLSPQEAAVQLRAYVDRAQLSPDPAYRAYQETMVQENCRLIAQLHNTATPAQREHAVMKLRGWQRDLRDMSGQP